MKKITLIITGVLFTLNVLGQAPNWAWAKSTGGTYNEWGYSVCTDLVGNVYMTGIFSSPSITFGTTILTNSDSTGYPTDIFIVKYDAGGNVLWARAAGGGNTANFGVSVSTDVSGNVFITGFFETSITFGTTTLANFDTIGNSADIYIVKYDSSGNVLWAKSAGGTSSDAAISASTDTSGNVFITGNFQSPSITFGTTTLTNTDTSGSNVDIFITKYDVSGNVLWAKSIGGDSAEYGTSVSTDASGNVFMAGIFRSPTITFGTTTLTNSGSGDVFMVKYDASGNVVWAKSAGGTAFDEGYGISTDMSGNVFMTGWFSSPSISFGTTTLTNAGVEDIFIVKYDAFGNVLWAKSEGGISNDRGASVCTNASGNVFLTGWFYSPSVIIGTTTLTNAGSEDIFVAEYDAFGNVLWVKSAGETSYDFSISVCTDVIGNLFIAGGFRSPSIQFGTTTLTNTDTSSIDIFIAKLNGTVGIEEMDNGMSFTVAPNPFTSQTTISFSESQKNTIIKITDILGKEIKTIHFTGKQCVMEKGEMERGIYFVRIEDENKNVVNRKVVLQ